MSKPTDAELDALKPHLLLFQDPATTLLPYVPHDSSLDATFDTMANMDSVKDIAFAVLLFPPSGGVRAYFHKPDEVWDIGSSGKLSILIAAAALRSDLRALQTAGLVNAGNADALMRYVWTRHPDADIQRLSMSGHFPQPSTLFDFSKTPLDFDGDAPDFDFLDTISNNGHINADNLGGIPFQDRLHLAIGHSDNRAARSVQGQLGIDYINAVVAKLGLFSAKQQRGLRVTGPYSVQHPELPRGFPQPTAISRINGRGIAGRTMAVPYAATASSLAMLMNAIVFGKFPRADMGDAARDFLLKREGHSMRSFALEGVQLARSTMSLPTAQTLALTKLGINWGNAEFLYVEFNEIKFGLIMLGLRPKRVSGHNLKSGAMGMFLASILYDDIHNQQWTLPGPGPGP